MKDATCTSCLRPKANLVCEVCEETVCKGCAQTVTEDSFALMESIPPEASHKLYCSGCFASLVEPLLQNYQATVEAAKNVNVFEKSRAKETRHFSRKEDLIHTPDCLDRDEAVLRIAFLAAVSGFENIIDVSLSSRKVRNGGYQHLVWKASGRPAKYNRST